MRRFGNLPVLVMLMGICAAAMFVPALHAVLERDHAVARAFFYSGTLFLILVAMIGFATAANRRDDSARGPLLTLVGAFTLLPLMLAVPFAEAIPDTTYLNAWWEMVSSLTTTGATLFHPDRLPPSVHLWRALVGWMGGGFVLISAVAVLAPMNLGGFEVLGAGASPGAGGGGIQALRMIDLRGRLARSSLTILPVYAGLTLLLWIALVLTGDPGLIAACHAMSTLSTSGISPLGGLAPTTSGLGGEVLIFVFLLMVSHQGVRLGRSTHIVDMADEARRADFTALSNSAIGVLLLAASGFGLLAETFGAKVVLLVFAAMSAFAALAALGLDEVQQGQNA